MRWIWLAAVLLLGCGNDVAANQPPADATVTSNVDAADAAGPDADPATITRVSGHITADTQWSSTIEIQGDTWVDPNVTVTVLSHATITVAEDATIYIDGTLALMGTRTGKITMRFTHDNWFGNGIDIAEQEGPPVSVTSAAAGSPPERRPRRGSRPTISRRPS